MNHEQDTYYQEDMPLFKGVFNYFRDSNTSRPVPVRGKIHSSHEHYSDIHFEIVPITTPKGERTYVNIHPYVEEPNIVLTVGMPPHGYADSNAIGKVQSARVEGLRPIEIGNIQAWYYPADTTLVLWECYFHQSFREDTPLMEDTNMRRLWQQTEKQLHAKFPQAERIVTPFSDPLFETEEYQTFLRSLDYEPVAKAAYGKLL
jgi:hypothetical protein